MNTEKTDDHRYVSELVWLPTYLMVAIFVFSRIDNPLIAVIAIFVVPMVIRIILEVMYSFLFGAKRLTLKIGVTGFLCQLAVWGGLVFWLDQQ